MPLPLLSEHIPSRLHPPQQPIARHRLDGTAQVLGEAEQLARLYRAEAFGILLEQRHNTPTHGPPGRGPGLRHGGGWLPLAASASMAVKRWSKPSRRTSMAATVSAI